MYSGSLLTLCGIGGFTCSFYLSGDLPTDTGIVVADPADIAANTIEVCLADAERRARGKSAYETHPDFDGFHCVECEAVIPPQRLRLGRVRCVDCQTVKEREEQMRPYNVKAE